MKRNKTKDLLPASDKDIENLIEEKEVIKELLKICNLIMRR
jgi:hypothetical protein